MSVVRQSKSFSVYIVGSSQYKTTLTHRCVFHRVTLRPAAEDYQFALFKAKNIDDSLQSITVPSKTQNLRFNKQHQKTRTCFVY